MKGLTFRAVLSILTVLLLGSASSAHAFYGDDFGVADVNEAGFETAPALPGTKAIWAGTCDLAGLSTGHGGTGEAPSIAAHCLDRGESNISAPRANIWAAGSTPSWRLDPRAEAGGHPDATAAFWLRRSATEGTDSAPHPEGNVRRIYVDLPAGVIGNPNAVPECSADLIRYVAAKCPPSSQVGIATVVLTNSITLGDFLTLYVPVYRVEPRRGYAAEFLISGVLGMTNVPILASARTDGDFGVRTAVIEVPAGLPLHASLVTFWGVPWSSANDKWRPPAGVAYIPPDGLPNEYGEQPVSYDPSWGPINPFFANPTRCTDEAPVTLFSANTWQNPATWISEPVPADEPVVDCEPLKFEPMISVSSGVRSSDSAGSFEVELLVPQNNDPPAALAANADSEEGAPAYWQTTAGRTTAHLRDTVVWMPEGVSINPSGGDGLEACSLEQMGYKGNDYPDPNPIRFEDYVDPTRKLAVSCPEASKIGDLEIDTPLLDQPVEGTVYLAEQNENPFDSTYAIYLVAQSKDRDVVVKLAGKVEADEKTGRLKATFLDNPQLPFDSFRLRFKPGPRSPLATPFVCAVFRSAAGHLSVQRPRMGLTFRGCGKVRRMSNR